MEAVMTVDALLDRLLAKEGGFVDHPADREGPTNWGITSAVARGEVFMGDMADLPQSLARSIYRRRYWETPGFHRVAEIAAEVSEALFDNGGHMGPAVAVRSEEHPSGLQSLKRTSNAVV